MRTVVFTVLAVAFAVWYAVQRGRVTRARDYNAATARWEEEGGNSRSPAAVGGDQPVTS